MRPHLQISTLCNKNRYPGNEVETLKKKINTTIFHGRTSDCHLKQTCISINLSLISSFVKPGCIKHFSEKIVTLFYCVHSKVTTKLIFQYKSKFSWFVSPAWPRRLSSIQTRIGCDIQWYWYDCSLHPSSLDSTFYVIPRVGKG